MPVHRRLRLLTFPARAGRGLPRPGRHEASQVPTWCLCAGWGLRPCPSVSTSHRGAAHVAFDRMEGLGLGDIDGFAAQWPTPHNRCVRFVAAVADGTHATLTTRRALPLTWAGLPPAGTRQLPGAHGHVLCLWVTGPTLARPVTHTASSETQARSKRSRFITFVHAATKSRTNASFESSQA